MASRHEPDVRSEGYGGVAGRRFQEKSEGWVRGNDDVADDARPDDGASIDEVVERLSRDLARAVSAAPSEEHDELRSYATGLVREDTSPQGSRDRKPTRRARLSFFAVAVWLAVAGALLTFLFPAAGLVCFLMAGVAAILAALLGPGEARPERSADPDVRT